MRNRRLFNFSVGILLVVFGLVLAMHESIHYRDISFLPISLGVTVILILLFTEVGRRGSLGNKGLSYESYKVLSILLGFALAFIILGVIVPLMQG